MSALLTTELLDEWTDPDTAMEAVGTNLGIFTDDGPSPARILAGDEQLRDRLFGVLLSLVDRGDLEMRPCGGGRHAFRWREAKSPDAATAAVAAAAEAPAEIPLPKPAPPADVPVVAEATAPISEPKAPRPIAQAPLLVVPAVSCLVAVLVYLWFDGAVAFAIGAALLLGGVIGIIRRVPFAGAWTLGLVAAALLVRFS